MNKYALEDLWFEVNEGDLNILSDGETLTITVYPVDGGQTQTANPIWSLSFPLAISKATA